MAITITSVVGNGSPVPSDITITGTVTNCERVLVTSSCYTGPQTFYATIQPGPSPQTWTVTIPNTKRCRCGDQITVTAQCVLGEPATATWGPQPLPCGECPKITVDPPIVSTTCVGGKRTVTLTTHVSQSATTTAVLQWDFGDGSSGTAFVVTGNTPPAGVAQTHDYVAPSTGSSSFTAALMVILPQGCPSTTVTVTVPACPPSCPTVTVDPPSVATTCVGGKRTVTLTTHASQGATQTSVYQWDYGDGTLGVAFPVTGNTPPAGVSDTPDYTAPTTGSTTYTATLKTITPLNCPDVSVTVTVPACPAAPCPQVTDVTFAEGPCDAQGRRSVTATAVVSGGPVGAYWWSWDNAPSQQAGSTSPAQSFVGGSTHTIQVTILTGQQCVGQFTKSLTITPCPGTTAPPTTAPPTTAPPTTAPPTTAPPTTAPPTTAPPTTVPPTTAPPTTVPPTTAPPSTGGCLCALLLVLALAFIAVAAIALLAWGCGGFTNVALLILAITAAVIGIILLVLWALLCRDCAAIRFLITTFGLLMAAMIILAIILFLFGQVACAIGALIVAAFFALLGLLLRVLGRAVRCF